MNNIQFKISGQDRKDKKKELSKLRYFLKYFWHYHQVDKDMHSFFKSENNINEDQSIKLYNKMKEEADFLERLLSVKCS